ncbi:hypothetical protein [Streptomyces chartreusis]|uniref:hypothetical protein n=1 Tax=Streptomyces chartreusis TaxID=1969 RepID=UPI002E18D7DE
MVGAAVGAETTGLVVSAVEALVRRVRNRPAAPGQEAPAPPLLDAAYVEAPAHHAEQRPKTQIRHPRVRGVRQQGRLLDSQA